MQHRKKEYLKKYILQYKGVIVAKLKQNDSIIKQVIAKNTRGKKRQIAQLTIKIDTQIDQALIKLSTALGISKNRLIEDILRQSGVVEEVEENYHV